MHLFIVVTIVWEEIKKEKKKKTNAKHRLYPRHIHCCSEWLPVIYFEIVFDVFQLFVIWEETFLCWCRFEYISSAFATNPHSAQRAAAHIIISVGWLNTLEQETVHFGLVSTISTCWCLRMHRPLLLNARAYQDWTKQKRKKNDNHNSVTYSVSRKTHKFYYRTFHRRVFVGGFCVQLNSTFFIFSVFCVRTAPRFLADEEAEKMANIIEICFSCGGKIHNIEIPLHLYTNLFTFPPIPSMPPQHRQRQSVTHYCKFFSTWNDGKCQNAAEQIVRCTQRASTNLLMPSYVIWINSICEKSKKINMTGIYSYRIYINS